jgi:hypothetical protein
MNEISGSHARSGKKTDIYVGAAKKKVPEPRVMAAA